MHVKFTVNEILDGDLHFTSRNRMVWDKYSEARFSFGDCPGATIASYEIMDADNAAIIREDMDDLEYPEDIRRILERVMNSGYYWSFRRNREKAMDNALTYGFLAASLAELTEGVVVSWDYAWDKAATPIYPECIYTLYFRPELCEDPIEASWFKRCLDYLSSHLKLSVC